MQTTSNNKPILRDAEQNIGNSIVLSPQPGLANGTATVEPEQSPPRIIILNGGSLVGQTTSIVVTASRLTSQQNPTPGIPGPVTGIIEYGNGGRSTRAEFDIPIGPFVGEILGVAQATSPQDGIVTISVPTSTIRILARYDNLLIAPLLANSVPTAGGQAMLADVQGVPRLGPGGSVNYGGPPGPAVVPAEPLRVQAMAAYFTRHYSKVYKTLYCYLGIPAGGVPTPVAVSSSALPSLTPALYALPAFTQSVKVLRIPTSALTISLLSTTRVVEQVTVGAGAATPIIPIIGHENIIGIQSTGAAETVTYLAIVCEVGL